MIRIVLSNRWKVQDIILNILEHLLNRFVLLFLLLV